MTKKDELIIGIINKNLKSLKKLLKSQEKQIKDIDKNGFDSEIHPAYHIDIRTGLSYTQGYCIGHIKLAEDMIELLSLNDAKDIEDIIEKDKKIEKENKKHFDEMFGDLKERVKKNKK